MYLDESVTHVPRPYPWQGCAAVRTHLQAGAKANRSIRSQFVCWLSSGDSRQAAGVRSGVVVTHSAHVLAYRASLSKPLQAGATLHAMPPRENKKNKEPHPQDKKKKPTTKGSNLLVERKESIKTFSRLLQSFLDRLFFRWNRHFANKRRHL